MSNGNSEFGNFNLENYKANGLVVAMNSWGEIEISPGETSKISTVDLLDCTAIAFVTDKNNGNKLAYIQHFGPSKKSDSLSALSEALDRHSQSIVGRSRVIILYPSKPNLNSTDVNGLEINDLGFSLLASEVCLRKLGPETDLDINPYMISESTTYKDDSLTIEIEKDGSYSIGLFSNLN